MLIIFFELILCVTLVLYTREYEFPSNKAHLIVIKKLEIEMDWVV